MFRAIFINRFQINKYPYLWVLITAVALTLCGLVVSIMSLIFNGVVIIEYLITGLVLSILLIPVIGNMKLFFDDKFSDISLKNELRLTQTILDKSKTAFFRISRTGQIQYVNEYACLSLGYSKDELIGMYPWEFDPDFKASDWPALWDLIVKEGIINIQTRHQRKDSSIFDVDVTGHYISVNGEEFSFTLVQDISERKQTETALRQKEGYQRALLDNFSFNVWFKDTESRFLAVNQTLADTLGYPDKDSLIGKDDFDIASPELAEHYRKDDLEVMTSRQQKFVQEEFKGTIGDIWVETFKAPAIDEAGILLGTVGFSRDITERKAIEAELQIAAIAFESQEGMIITDAHSTILKINHSFTRITGYSAEEAVGKKMQLLKSGIHDNSFYLAMWETINEKEVGKVKYGTVVKMVKRIQNG